MEGVTNRESRKAANRRERVWITWISGTKKLLLNGTMPLCCFQLMQPPRNEPRYSLVLNLRKGLYHA
jgi:hypothetical protein